MLAAAATAFRRVLASETEPDATPLPDVMGEAEGELKTPLMSCCDDMWEGEPKREAIVEEEGMRNKTWGAREKVKRIT